MAKTRRLTKLVKLDGTSWGSGSDWFVSTAMLRSHTGTPSPVESAIMIGILGILRLGRSIIDLQEQFDWES